jgi:hypothetical protein
MQVKLHIVPGIRYPPRDPAHRFNPEIGCLQGFDEEGGSQSKLVKTIEQKSQAVLFPVALAKDNRLGNRGQFWVLEITTDAELGIDGDTDLDRFREDS